MKPLQKRGIFSADDLRIVFSDIAIILGANTKLLKELESRTKTKHPSIMIGDVFLQMVEWIFVYVTLQSPALRVYTQFVNNYEIALKKIKDFNKNPEYIDFLEVKEYIK